MISTTNVRLASNAVIKNAKCGWKQAMSNVDFKPRIRFQKRPSVRTIGNDDQDMSVDVEKFGSICKSFVEMLRTRNVEGRKK